MEYLIVTFADDRQVMIDKKPQGRTNEVIEVERGTHTVSLEKPPFDFHPTEITLILQDTTALSPKEVRYEKV